MAIQLSVTVGTSMYQPGVLRTVPHTMLSVIMNDRALEICRLAFESVDVVREALLPRPLTPEGHSAETVVTIKGGIGDMKWGGRH